MLYPAFLLPAALFAWAYWRFVKRRNVWRDGAVVCLFLLFGHPMLSRRTAALDVVAVVDRSASITPANRASQDEILDLLERNLEQGDRLAVVSFGERAYLEGFYLAGEDFSKFHNPYGEDASSIDEGLKLALEVADFQNRNVRFVLLSDGEYTGLDPLGRARRAAEAGASIHYRRLETPAYFDLAARDAESPSKVLAREPFRLAFEVYCSEERQGLYRVKRDGKPLALPGSDAKGWRQRLFRAGYNRVEVADVAARQGTYRYEIEVESDKEERLSANNSAETFVHVAGEDRVLVVNQDGEPDNVARALAGAGIPVGVVAADKFDFDILFLRGYKAIVLNNAPVVGVPHATLLDLRRFVEQEGGGLFVAGGNKSFAAGGYYESPLEDILPVSMEMEEREVRTSMALSVALDRSGSMSMTVGSGETKMDLANRGTAAALDALGPNDSISVIAVDSLAHVIVEQGGVGSGSGIRDKILSIESMGGGIFVYEALVAAGEQIANASQTNKHIILFADAADAEAPGDYKNLLNEFRDAGITCSVVGLGRNTDPDAFLLEDIAARGDGEVYFTDDPRQLPQIFSFDTMKRMRQTFEAVEPAPWSVTPLADILASGRNWTDFSSTGYNLLFPRREAETAIVSGDEDAAPGLAFWQRGSGRVAALALSPEGPFASVPFFDELVLDATRWAMGSDVRDSFHLKAHRAGNRAVATLELSEKERQNFRSAELKVFAPDGSERALPMRWVSHDRLEVDFPLDQTGAFRGMLQLNDQQVRMDPVGLPGSPEFLRDFPQGYGRESLAKIAAETGGSEVLDFRKLFDRESKTYARRPFVYPLMLAALVFLLLDIAEQRFAMLPAMRRRLGPLLERLKDWKAEREEAALRRRTSRESRLAGVSSQGVKAVPGAVAVNRSKKERRFAEKSAKALDAKAASPGKKSSKKKAASEPRPTEGLSALKAAKDRAKDRMG